MHDRTTTTKPASVRERTNQIAKDGILKTFADDACFLAMYMVQGAYLLLALFLKADGR